MPRTKISFSISKKIRDIYVISTILHIENTKINIDLFLDEDNTFGLMLNDQFYHSSNENILILMTSKKGIKDVIKLTFK